MDGEANVEKIGQIFLSSTLPLLLGPSCSLSCPNWFSELVIATMGRFGLFPLALLSLQAFCGGAFAAVVCLLRSFGSFFWFSHSRDICGI